MKHSVLRAFSTPTRRFAVGQVITQGDVDGPVPVERLAELGYVAPVPPIPEDLPKAAGDLPPADEVESDEAGHEA